MYFLERLKLNLNEIKTLHSATFSDLASLKYLNLKSNQCLVKLHQDLFKNLVNLIELSLRDCEIRMLKDEVFKNLTSLEKLDLSFNGISKVCVKSFSGLVNLKELKVLKNEISEIEEGALDHMTNLRNLNLSLNRIDKVNFLDGLDSLDVLNLKENMIENIEPSVEKKLSKLRFNLKDNLIEKYNETDDGQYSEISLASISMSDEGSVDDRYDGDMLDEVLDNDSDDLDYDSEAW